MVNERDDCVEVVCADPLDTDALDDVRATFGKPIEARGAQRRSGDRRDQPRLRAPGDRRASSSATTALEEDDAIDILDSDDDAPIIRWVNGLFYTGGEGARQRHSHRAREKEVLVRYRIDGELYVARRASRQFMSSVVARVKIMAGLNIAEKRLPQDGRITLKIAGRASTSASRPSRPAAITSAS